MYLQKAIWYVTDYITRLVKMKLLILPQTHCFQGFARLWTVWITSGEVIMETIHQTVKSGLFRVLFFS
jgi:hypothetical protein